MMSEKTGHMKNQGKTGHPDNISNSNRKKRDLLGNSGVPGNLEKKVILGKTGHPTNSAAHSESRLHIRSHIHAKIENHIVASA